MKSVRRTIAGMMILLLLGGGAAGTYVYCMWSRGDEQLARTLREKLAEIAPGWNVSLGTHHIDLQGKVHLYDVTIPGDDPSEPLLEMAEVVLVVDRETLLDAQPDIRRIRIIRPRVNLVRGADGIWNAARLPPLKPLRDIVPEFHWESGTIVVRLDDASAGAAPAVQFDSVTVHMVPEGKRRFSIRTSATFAGADDLAVEGHWNIDDRSWSMEGDVANLTIDRRLLELVAEFSPEFRRGLERCDAWSPPGDASRAKVPAADRGPVRGGTATGPARFDVSAAADVRFRFASRSPDVGPEYRLELDLLRGEMNHPALGYPLRELHGRISIDEELIEGQELSAQSLGTQITLERGRIRRQDDLRPVEFDVVVADLPLDERLYRLLPPESRRNWDLVHPRGRIDARLHFESNGAQRWEHHGTITVRDASASHEKFPYRVDQIHGTIKCAAGEAIDLALEGRSGTQPIKLQGKVRGKSPEGQFDYLIESPGLPIDAKLRAACSKRFADILDKLELQGEVNGWVRFTRVAGGGKEIRQTIKGRLQQGALRFQGFPYPLSDVTGDFEGAGDSWDFTDFQGRHGKAEVRWDGAIRKPDPRSAPHLDLGIDARNIPCDETLKGALSPALRETWNELTPTGFLDATGHVGWTEGALPEIDLDAKFRDGKLKLLSLPIPFENVQSDLGYHEGRVTIESISGQHEGTNFHARGTAEFPQEGEWHLQLSDLRVDDLVFDRTIRKALPKNLQKVIDAFDPHGKVSVKGEVAFRGKKGAGNPVTAAWDTTTYYSGTTINAGGIELKDLYGKARFQGSWDGTDFFGNGWIDLNSVRIFDRYQLADVTGPITIAGEKLIVGSKEAIVSRFINPADSPKRLTAKFIDGIIGLDAIVEFGPPMRYHTKITLTNGELKRYAKSYMPGSGRLAGLMNGMIDLHGEGSEARNLNGNGELVISPAALYDLPLIVAIFQQLKLVPANDAAFDRAVFKFDIGESKVQFGEIDLMGDAVHLVGGGRVAFKGDVNLEFLSRAGRQQLALPIVREIIQLTTNGMVGVTVRGNLRNSGPLDVRITPFQQIDSAVRSLLGLFEPPNPRGQRR